ncbi:MAG: diphosphatase [Myxococcales bacterium]|jgi:NAD+ diphosphatase|nr:diphosphatase [Myxococcales bacterium]
MEFVPGIDATDRLAGPAALYFVVHPKGLVVQRSESGQPRMLDAPAMANVTALDAAHHFLGRLDGNDVYAVAAAGGDAPIAEPFELVGLRALHGAVDEIVFGVAARAVQIVEWATTHRFCGRCATPTERTPGERAMRCPACGLSAYPRIAPAIIVLVRKGDLALLAHGARFPAPFYSTLAGFVEPGESLEETLVREVKEEVGIEVDDIRYFGSQSWPFPHSLMLGFFASWKSGEIVCEPSEILDAKWFNAGALPMIPPPMSISRKLIDAWLADVGAPEAPAIKP